MARLSWVQRLYWRYLSKPACERALFLHVLEKPIGSILEIGIGAGDRAVSFSCRRQIGDAFHSTLRTRPRHALLCASLQ
jgi:hypothetical protein